MCAFHLPYCMVELSTFNHFSTIDLVQADEFAKVYIPMNTAKNTKWALTAF